MIGGGCQKRSDGLAIRWEATRRSWRSRSDAWPPWASGLVGLRPPSAGVRSRRPSSSGPVPSTSYSTLLTKVKVLEKSSKTMLIANLDQWFVCSQMTLFTWKTRGFGLRPSRMTLEKFTKVIHTCLVTYDVWDML